MLLLDFLLVESYNHMHKSSHMHFDNALHGQSQPHSIYKQPTRKFHFQCIVCISFGIYKIVFSLSAKCNATSECISFHQHQKKGVTRKFVTFFFVLPGAPHISCEKFYIVN